MLSMTAAGVIAKEGRIRMAPTKKAKSQSSVLYMVFCILCFTVPFWGIK